MTDSEMLERRCRSWERTRNRGQVLYAIVRGAILTSFWLLIRIPFYGIGKHGMSYESIAIVSVIVFLMACYEAPQSWKRAERRYESDMQYLEVMKRQDSMPTTYAVAGLGYPTLLAGIHQHCANKKTTANQRWFFR